MSIHKYLTHGGLPPDVLEDTHINKVICDGLTDKLKFCKTHEEFLRIALKKEKPRKYTSWLAIFRREAEELLTFQSKVASTSTSSKKNPYQPSSHSSNQRDRGRARSDSQDRTRHDSNRRNSDWRKTSYSPDRSDRSDRKRRDGRGRSSDRNQRDKDNDSPSQKKRGGEDPSQNTDKKSKHESDAVWQTAIPRVVVTRLTNSLTRI